MRTPGRKDRIRLQLGLLPEISNLGLLDAPRNAPAAPPAPPAPPGAPVAPGGTGSGQGGFLGQLGGAMGQVFGGADDPRLSPAQNEAARKQAMIQAGLATLGATGQGADPFAAIAAGGMAGQEAGGAFREQAYAMTAHERLSKALQDPRIMSMFTEQERMLIAVLPPNEAVKMIAEKLKPRDTTKVVGPGAALVDEKGTALYQQEKEPEPLPPDLRAVMWELGIDPESADPETKKMAMEEYAKLKRSGASSVTVNTAADKDFAQVSTLSGDYQRAIATHQVVADSYGTVLATANDPSAAGDLSLIFAYMKILDPGSVVRETEFANAQNAASVPERIRAKYNQMVRTGERLTAGQRADFLDQATRIAQSRQNQLRPIMERYKMRAGLVGMDPSLVVFDPFEEVKTRPDAVGPTNPMLAPLEKP